MPRRPTPKFVMDLHIEAEVADEALGALLLAAKEQLEQQAQAYLDFETEDRLLERLTKEVFRHHPAAAQMAQAVLAVFKDEMQRTQLRLGQVEGRLQETKEALPVEPPQLPSPRKRLKG